MIGLCRFVVIDLSAGPCTYGKIETEEGSVIYRLMPRLSQIIFPRGLAAPSASSTQDIFIGQLGGLIATTIEHVIAPDIRYFQKVEIPCFIQCFFIIWWMTEMVGIFYLDWMKYSRQAIRYLYCLLFNMWWSQVPKNFHYYATLVPVYGQ